MKLFAFIFLLFFSYSLWSKANSFFEPPKNNQTKNTVLLFKALSLVKKGAKLLWIYFPSLERGKKQLYYLKQKPIKKLRIIVTKLNDQTWAISHHYHENKKFIAG